MKKIYLCFLSLISIVTFSQSNLTLTRAGQEPVIGDVYSTQDFDSVGVVPKSTGAGQFWNFSSSVQNTNTALSSYVSTVAVPASSTFPGATLVEDQGAGNYNFWKSASTPTTQWELMGSLNTSTTPAQGVKFSNTAIAGIWPMAPGDTYTDTFVGNIVGLPLFGTGSVSGTQTVTSCGSGTITLPNGVVYSPVIQVQVNQKYTTSIHILTITISNTNTATQYMYFHASQKFQLLDLQYSTQNSGTTTTKSFQMSASKNITIGLRDDAFSKSFSFYPNPAYNQINFQVSNQNKEACSISILNLLGQEVKQLQMGSGATIQEKIDVSDLAKGTYIFKTQVGQKSESRRLLIE
ncbi:MAG: T9SS type A sorting domain-containing protein [Bacteroidota bacterium]